MDCPILCADGENQASCPDANCPLFDGQNETCFLQQADAFLQRDDLPAATHAALQRLSDVGHGLLSVTGTPESTLSFLVSDVEKRRKGQEELLQALSRTETSNAVLRGEVRTLVDRLATLESGLGNVEERLSSVARTVGALHTDQFRVAEQLTGDLSRPVEALASRLDEEAAGIRRVLKDLSGRTNDLTALGKEMSGEIHTVTVRQEEHDLAERRGQDDLTENLEELLRETGKLSGQVADLASQQESAEGRREGCAKQHHQQLQELVAVLDTHLDSLGGRMEEHARRVESPLNGARAALETWQGDAHQVLAALHERDVEDQRGRQRAREEEARELNARGVLLFHQGSLEAAELAFRRAAELRPDFAEAHNNLGLVQSRLGEEDAAVDSFQKAMSCGQELPAALNNLGFLYHAQMRDAEAVEMFQKALQADPTMAPAFVNLGNAYYRQGNHAQALDAWRRALQLDPVNEDAERAIRSFDLQADTARN